MNAVEEVILATESLNANWVSCLLQSDGVYMNRDRASFLALLSKCFENLKNAGETHLVQRKGRCRDASDGNSYIFFGNVTGDYLEILVFLDEHEELGIQECYCLTENDREFAPGVRLFVDPDKGSPF